VGRRQAAARRAGDGASAWQLDPFPTIHDDLGDTDTAIEIERASESPRRQTPTRIALPSPELLRALAIENATETEVYGEAGEPRTPPRSVAAYRPQVVTELLPVPQVVTELLPLPQLPQPARERGFVTEPSQRESQQMMAAFAEVAASRARARANALAQPLFFAPAPAAPTPPPFAPTPAPCLEPTPTEAPRRTLTRRTRRSRAKGAAGALLLVFVDAFVFAACYWYWILAR
jgi:hypothetical protein